MLHRLARALEKIPEGHKMCSACGHVGSDVQSSDYLCDDIEAWRRKG